MDESEGRNRTDGSVGDVSQAHTHPQPVRYYSMTTVAQPVGRGHRFPGRQMCLGNVPKNVCEPMRVKTREWSGIWIVLQYALTCLLERDRSPSPARACPKSPQEFKTRSGLWKANLLPGNGEDKPWLYFPISPLVPPRWDREARGQHGGPVFLLSQTECAEMLRIRRRPPKVFEWYISLSHKEGDVQLSVRTVMMRMAREPYGTAFTAASKNLVR